MLQRELLEKVLRNLMLVENDTKSDDPVAYLAEAFDTLSAVQECDARSMMLEKYFTTMDISDYMLRNALFADAIGMARAVIRGYVRNSMLAAFDAGFDRFFTVAAGCGKTHPTYIVPDAVTYKCCSKTYRLLVPSASGGRMCYNSFLERLAVTGAVHMMRFAARVISLDACWDVLWSFIESRSAEWTLTFSLSYQFVSKLECLRIVCGCITPEKMPKIVEKLQKAISNNDIHTMPLLTIIRSFVTNICRKEAESMLAENLPLQMLDTHTRKDMELTGACGSMLLSRLLMEREAFKRVQNLQLTGERHYLLVLSDNTNLGRLMRYVNPDTQKLVRRFLKRMYEFQPVRYGMECRPKIQFAEHDGYALSRFYEFAAKESYEPLLLIQIAAVARLFGAIFRDPQRSRMDPLPDYPDIVNVIPVARVAGNYL